MTANATYRLRFWTGPCDVERIAGKVREIGLSVIVGTEVLVIDEEGSDALDASAKVVDAMRTSHGTDFGMRLISRQRLAA